MDIVIVNPSLSLFQQKLLDAVRTGTLPGEGLAAVKRDGVLLVQKTVERYFPASAKEESYTYAVRMVDLILSFALSQGGSLTAETVGEIFKRGLLTLKKMDEMPIVAYIPRVPDDDGNSLRKIKDKVRSKAFDPKQELALLRAELQRKEESLSLVVFTEYLIGLRHKNNFHEFIEYTFNRGAGVEDCDKIVASYLFSLAFKLDCGYELTIESLARALKKKVPSPEKAKELFTSHRTSIPGEYLEEYDKAVARFFKHSAIASLLGGKRVSAKRLYLGDQAALYCGRALDNTEYFGTEFEPE